jgi:putative nucleotidyltransferase with HDIG domain
MCPARAARTKRIDRILTRSPRGTQFSLHRESKATDNHNARVKQREQKQAGGALPRKPKLCTGREVQRQEKPVKKAPFRTRATRTRRGSSSACAIGRPLPFPAFTPREVAALGGLPLAEKTLQEILLRSMLKARVLGEAGHEHSRTCFVGSETGIAEQFMNFVSALASSIDAKDPYTRGHSKRVTKYSLAIAEAIRLEEDEIEDLELAGYLHDIGKIGTPHEILKKPFRLTDEEFDIVKKHPLNGVRILENLKNLQRVSSFILHHHERPDGTGYPHGLAGDAIPVGARILAVADAFDAITSDRPYRKRASVEEALLEIERNAGRQFDTRIVRVFASLVRSGKLDTNRHPPRRPILQKA